MFGGGVSVWCFLGFCWGSACWGVFLFFLCILSGLGLLFGCYMVVGLVFVGVFLG